MSKLLTTTALAACVVVLAAPAMAQDADWSGPYIGIYGGATGANDQEDEFLRFDRNLDGDFGDTVTTVGGMDAFTPGSCGGDAGGPAVANGCDDDSMGIQASIRGGWDFQFGGFVVGALGEYSYVDQQDAVTSFSSTPASYTFNRNLDELAAARLRAGYAFGPALVYGTGGYAWGKIDNTFYSSNGVNSFTALSDEEDADGWQAGGGVEYKLTDNLSVTGEYLYTSLEADEFDVRVGLGNAPATNPFVLPPNTTGTDLRRSNGRFGLHAVNIGMNYRF